MKVFPESCLYPGPVLSNVGLYSSGPEYLLYPVYPPARNNILASMTQLSAQVQLGPLLLEYCQLVTLAPSARTP